MEAVAERRRRALPNGPIPGEFHYEGHRQSQLWLEVARRHAPPGLDTFYRQAFTMVPTGTFSHLISLGAGGARKEGWLQQRITANRFTPVDVSDSLALLSAQHLRTLVEKPPRPIVADLTQFPGLPDWLSTFDEEEPRLYTAFGLTPNLNPEELDPILRGFLRPEDRLLVSANLMPGGRIDSVLPQYDNPETQRWLNELLIQWGIAPHLANLSIQGDENGDGTARIVASTSWLHNWLLDWEGTTLHVSRDQPLQVFASLRYTPGGFLRRLSSAGFDVTDEAISVCGQEGLWLVKSPS